MTKKPWRTSLMLFALFPIATVISILFVDAYGECRKLANFQLCFDGLINPGKVGFKRLISDEELIDRFQKHRRTFDELAAFSLAHPGGDTELPPEDWEQRLGISWIQRSSSGAPEIRDSSEETSCIQSPPVGVSVIECIKQKRQWKRLQFRADVTRTIDKKFWPYSNLVKYYSYFPREPVFDNGRIRSSQDRLTLLQLHRDLDKDWPVGWPTENNEPHCLMRQIEAHWYLKLCKNDIGG